MYGLESSIYLKFHPLLNESKEIKEKYVSIFSYFVIKYGNDIKLSNEIIKLYSRHFDINSNKSNDIAEIEKNINLLFNWKYQKQNGLYYKILLFEDILNYIDFSNSQKKIDFLKEISIYLDEEISEENKILINTIDIQTVQSSLKIILNHAIDDILILYQKQVIVNFIYALTLVALIWWPFLGITVAGIYAYIKKEKFLYVCKRAIINIFNFVKIIKFDIEKIISFRNVKQRDIYKLFECSFLNKQFLVKNPIKILITSNISAGKSTLINALIGKNIVPTSQETCTGNLCYIYNKQIEDDYICLKNGEFVIDTNENILNKIKWNTSNTISSYFRFLNQYNKKICIIDTPGVNSTINKNHGLITKKAIQEEVYDKLIFILNGNKLGSDEEINYLNWIIKNVDNNKIIFVLNKVDEFKMKDDNLLLSINRVKEDILKLGLKNPKIFPISAYFGLLIKLKKYNDELTEDELDEYEYYKKKFNRLKLNLYYSENDSEITGDEIIGLSKKCGLYELEKEIYGE